MVALDARRYEVTQKLLSFGNKYVIEADGEEVLRSKQKKFRLKEDFRFTTPDGDPALRVTTDKMLDVAATYTVVDEQTDEVVGTIERDVRSFLKHHWHLTDSDGTHLATIKEDSWARALVRRYLTTLLPFSYRIEGESGELGSIRGALSFRDRYTIDLTADAEGVLDPRLVVPAAVVVDAIEGN